MEITNAHAMVADAVAHGACTKSGTITDWRSLAWLFFTPQGLEFCTEKNYPSLQQFQEMASEARKFGIHVDGGDIVANNPRQIALIGETSATLSYEGTKEAHKVVVMHGAKAVIYAGDYAVIRLYNVGGDNDVRIYNDGTAVILK
jgi:hypothetical protein